MSATSLWRGIFTRLNSAMRRDAERFKGTALYSCEFEVTFTSSFYTAQKLRCNFQKCLKSVATCAWEMASPAARQLL